MATSVVVVDELVDEVEVELVEEVAAAVEDVDVGMLRLHAGDRPSPGG